MPIYRTAKKNNFQTLNLALDNPNYKSLKRPKRPPNPKPNIALKDPKASNPSRSLCNLKSIFRTPVLNTPSLALNFLRLAAQPYSVNPKPLNP